MPNCKFQTRHLAITIAAGHVSSCANCRQTMSLITPSAAAAAIAATVADTVGIMIALTIQ